MVDDIVNLLQLSFFFDFSSSSLMVPIPDCLRFGGDNAETWLEINIYFKEMKKNQKEVMNAPKKKGFISLSLITL